MGQMPRWKLFTIWGSPVYVEPLFLLLVAFFVFSGLTSVTQFAEQLMWAPVLFIGILWHEIGHALAIKKFGYGNSVIVLQGLGGVTINQRGETPPGKAAVISVAGPIFSFSLTLVFGLAAFLIPGEGLLNHLCFLMAAANLFWGVFNLLPISPLDGGHIVLHGLRAKFPRRKAYLYSAYSSLAAMALIGIPMVAIFNMSLIFIVILGFLFVSHNMQIIRAVQGGAL